MGNLIKSLAEIQKNCMNLLSSVQSNCEVMYSGDELNLLPEAMMVVAQNIVVFQKLHKYLQKLHICKQNFLLYGKLVSSTWWLR